MSVQVSVSVSTAVCVSGCAQPHVLCVGVYRRVSCVRAGTPTCRGVQPCLVHTGVCRGVCRGVHSHVCSVSCVSVFRHVSGCAQTCVRVQSCMSGCAQPHVSCVVCRGAQRSVLGCAQPCVLHVVCQGAHICMSGHAQVCVTVYVVVCTAVCAPCRVLGCSDTCWDVHSRVSGCAGVCQGAHGPVSGRAQRCALRVACWCHSHVSGCAQLCVRSYVGVCPAMCSPCRVGGTGVCSLCHVSECAHTELCVGGPSHVSGGTQQPPTPRRSTGQRPAEGHSCPQWRGRKIGRSGGAGAPTAVAGGGTQHPSQPGDTQCDRGDPQHPCVCSHPPAPPG